MSNNRPNGFVESQQFINYHQGINGPHSFYIPAQTEESTFFMDFTAMAYSRSFQYSFEFDAKYFF